ncbi:anaerobic sulfatase maturase [Vibrio hannami]|uniref:anaerobic sulfatase maturase n=1 Tax=Vibrio hannami TaxID=2717094 RepID=UPI00240F0154|nr:anaerobic sulfatase maturase [Vibrio hannami]MDG3086186.1 anaerobic sulfatase maturase [Vibrio hannami]
MTQTLPFSLTLKPVGSACNLDCSYCYYLKNESGCGAPMDFETLEIAIKNHIMSQPEHTPTVDFIWHGGEPLLRGREFYEYAFIQQNLWAGEKRVVNTFQTNGTLINTRWAEFFKRHNVMVGISLDGPNLLNDISRIDQHGNSSFEKTMRGLSLLKEHEVDFNTLTVINNRTYKHGSTIYQFLKEAGSTYMQFQPCLDHELDRRSEYDWSLNGEQWGQFLCDVFDEWCKEDIGKVHVQFFENCLMMLMGHPSQMCHHSEICGQQLMMEKDGSVFSCDHYHYNDRKLGNAVDHSLQTMVSGPHQRVFAEDKQSNLSLTCHHCDFLPLCNGGCPKYRLTSDTGVGKINVLCQGYKMFFQYALPRMLKMVDAMNNGYSAQFYMMY